MRAIADQLAAAGLSAHVHEGRDSIDVTATTRAEPGGREVKVIVDEDNYVELHYWNGPDATPAHVATAIVRALAVIAELL
jgi:hypothetical protein